MSPLVAVANLCCGRVVMDSFRTNTRNPMICLEFPNKQQQHKLATGISQTYECNSKYFTNIDSINFITISKICLVLSDVEYFLYIHAKSELCDIAESGRLEFPEFVTLAAKFIVEEDAEAMQKELREAFRLYDKEGKKVS